MAFSKAVALQPLVGLERKHYTKKKKLSFLLPGSEPLALMSQSPVAGPLVRSERSARTHTSQTFPSKKHGLVSSPLTALH